MFGCSRRRYSRLCRRSAADFAAGAPWYLTVVYRRRAGEENAFPGEEVILFRFGRVGVDGIIICEDDEAGALRRWVFHIFYFNVVYRNIAGQLCLVVCRDGRGFEKSLFLGSSPSVKRITWEPGMSFVCIQISLEDAFEGEDVVFSVIAPYQDSLSGRCGTFDRLNFVFLLFLFEISAAQDTVFYQFFPDIIEIGDFFCVIDKCGAQSQGNRSLFLFPSAGSFSTTAVFAFGVFF